MRIFSEVRASEGGSQALDLTRLVGVAREAILFGLKLGGCSGRHLSFGQSHLLIWGDEQVALDDLLLMRGASEKGLTRQILSQLPIIENPTSEPRRTWGWGVGCRKGHRRPEF